MTKLLVNVRIDRYATDRVNHYFKLKCQSLRFNHKNDLVATLSHTEAIKLRDELTAFILNNKLVGKRRK